MGSVPERDLQLEWSDLHMSSVIGRVWAGLKDGLLDVKCPRVLLLICLVCFIGCGDDPDGVFADRGAAEPDRSDRGDGRPDVYNSPPYPDWVIEDTPVSRLGVGIAEDGEQIFSDIRYVAHMSDGGVVVVDGGSSEVRWFAEDGTLRRRAGGPGQGPGEFSLVASAALLAGDTLALFDSRNQRLTWFDEAGAMVRTQRLELGPILGVRLQGVSGEHLMAVVESPQFNLGGREFNYAQDSVFVVLVSDGAPPDTTHRFPGREAATWVAYVDERPQASRQMEIPFGEATLVGGVDNSVVIARSGVPELVFLGFDGTVLGTAHRSDVNVTPVSSALRQRYVESMVVFAESRGLAPGPARAGAQGLLALLPEGRSLPVYDRMLVDEASGHIWIRGYMPAWADEDPQRWTVHDKRGWVLARLSTPAGFHVMHVAREHIAGVVRDGMDVESVVILRIWSSPELVDTSH